MKKKFKWLSSYAVTSSGAILEPGKEYKVEQFTEKMVESWVKEGAAEYIEENQKEKKKKREE